MGAGGRASLQLLPMHLCFGQPRIGNQPNMKFGFLDALPVVFLRLPTWCFVGIEILLAILGIPIWCFLVPSRYHFGVGVEILLASVLMVLALRFGAFWCWDW